MCFLWGFDMMMILSDFESDKKMVIQYGLMRGGY